MPEPMDRLVATSVNYFHANDERAFFEWIERVPCVASLDGILCDLFIDLARPPDDADLRELLAIFFRYGIDMRQLARFESDSNRAWLRDPRKFWYARVFAPDATRGPSE